MLYKSVFGFPFTSLLFYLFAKNSFFLSFFAHLLFPRGLTNLIKPKIK